MCSYSSCHAQPEQVIHYSPLRGDTEEAPHISNVTVLETVLEKHTHAPTAGACLIADGEQQPTHRSTWLEQDFVTCPDDVDAIFATYQLTNTTSYCAYRCCPPIISWAGQSAQWNPPGFLLTNLYDH